MGYPDWRKPVVPGLNSDEQVKVSATATATSGTFSQQVKTWIIYNDGPNPVYIDKDSTATTNSFKVPAKSYFGIAVATTYISFICATGETATVYLWGFY